MSVFSGHLRLRAVPAADGRTALAEQAFRTPFHIGKSYWEGGALQVRIVNATAGILAGDQLALEAVVDSGASLLLTTPAATRAFVMRSGAARAIQSFAVADGAWLEYAPEPLFPHRETDYEQITRLALSRDASACHTESLAPGRIAHGECFAWRRLRLSLDVVVDGRLRFRERLDTSGPAFAHHAAQFGASEAWFATMTLYGPPLEAPPPEWETGIRELDRPEVRVASTRLGPRLFVVRCIAGGSIALRDTLTRLRTHGAALFPPLRSDLRRL